LVYLPQQKSPEEVRATIRAALAGIPAEGRNLGAVMKAVLPQLKDSADGNLIRQIATEELSA
jgi:uncharacterized protein YqeY